MPNAIAREGGATVKVRSPRRRVLSRERLRLEVSEIRCDHGDGLFHLHDRLLVGLLIGALAGVLTLSARHDRHDETETRERSAELHAPGVNRVRATVKTAHQLSPRCQQTPDSPRDSLRRVMPRATFAFRESLPTTFPSP